MLKDRWVRCWIGIVLMLAVALAPWLLQSASKRIPPEFGRIRPGIPLAEVEAALGRKADDILNLQQAGEGKLVGIPATEAGDAKVLTWYGRTGDITVLIDRAGHVVEKGFNR
jgi:hypothetical protein